MSNVTEILLVIGVATLVVMIIAIVLGLLLKESQRPVRRVRQASLPPLHWGYKPLPSEGGRGHQERPPKPPEGSGGCSL